MGAKLTGDSPRVRLEWLRWVARVGEVEVQNQRWVRSMLKNVFCSADRLVTCVPCGDVKSKDAANTECVSKRAHGGRSPRRGRQFATGSAAPLLRKHPCLQLPSLHQALKPQHFEASDRNRAALKVPLNPPQSSHGSISIQDSLGLLFLEELLKLSG